MKRAAGTGRGKEGRNLGDRTASARPICWGFCAMHNESPVTIVGGSRQHQDARAIWHWRTRCGCSCSAAWLAVGAWNNLALHSNTQTRSSKARYVQHLLCYTFVGCVVVIPLVAIAGARSAVGFWLRYALRHRDSPLLCFSLGG